MAEWHLRSEKKPTGGLYSRFRKKRKMDSGQEFLEPKPGKRKAQRKKSRGGFVKVKLLAEEKANIADPAGKKTFTSRILTVAENPANPHYVRRNVITKGAIIKTEAGLARVTSRPGQDGVVNAILISEKKAK